VAIPTNAQALVVTTAALTVPEGSNATFMVCLAGQPSANVVVTVSSVDGPPNLVVQSGATNVFTPLNWSNPVPVVISALFDADRSNAVAVFRVASDGLAPFDVTATEQDLYPVPAPLDWAAPADITYGMALGPAQLNASSTIDGTYSYSPEPGAILFAGPSQSLQVTFRPSNSDMYLPVTTNVAVNVLQKILSVSASDATKVYGAPLPVFSATYSGFVNGDTVASLRSPASFTTPANASSPVGNYTIAPDGAAADNYSFSYSAGTLSITPAATIASLTSSANPALPGTAVTFTCSLAIVPDGAGRIDGLVQFKIDGANVGNPVAVANGAATYAAALPLGLHSVQADYLGSSNLTGSSAILAPSQLINTPPVAAADTIDRWPTNGARVAIATLLTNDYDPDGDPVSFVSCTNVSANGATLSIDNGWITYAPPPGFTNTDTFTYLISDGRGAPVSGTVLVGLKSVDPSLDLTVSHLDGSYRIHMVGVPGRTYRIQFTADIINPVWQDLANGTADESGVFEYIDTAVSSSRFYRAIYP